jgi:hypothetical protein
VEGPTKERWLELAELASKEQDPAKFTALIKEINDILEAKELRLKQTAGPMKRTAL